MSKLHREKRPPYETLTTPLRTNTPLSDEGLPNEMLQGSSTQRQMHRNRSAALCSSYHDSDNQPLRSSRGGGCRSMRANKGCETALRLLCHLNSRSIENGLEFTNCV